VGAKFALVPCDEHGMQVDALAETIERCRAHTGALPKLIYTVINYSNPAGVSLSLSRRKQLMEVARRFAIPVLEDDPYGELRYDNEQIASLFSMADEGVIYASSFSKILAPGTRVAWTIGDRELIRKMIMIKQGSDLCTSMVSQVLVAEYCARGYLDTHLEKIRSHYAKKAMAMNEALDRHLPKNAASFAKVRGGFFFWLKMAGRDTRELFLKAVQAGVAFVPGESFYPLAQDTVGPLIDGRDCARLCFTFATEQEIEEGCRRLASCLA
jgi:2-aminoadipate transaminase